jgi:prevent-host-death family protein
MKLAPVAQLKASLSRYLAGVKAGEEVFVTERGRLVAKIIPIAGPQDQEEQRLRKMESQGLLRMGSGKLPKGFWDAPRPPDRAGAVRKALLQERREGR